jgi:UDPglucose 6-dehydrogenase
MTAGRDEDGSVIQLQRSRGHSPFAGQRMRVAVVGVGYVGLVTGTCLALLGHRVTCVDTDCAKIAALRRGEVPIYEPDLADSIRRSAARLDFTTDFASAVRSAEIIFIAVGTPARADGEPDMQHFTAAIEEIARCLAPRAMVAIKSTVPIGTAAAARKLLSERTGRSDVSVASNPEFLREGTAVADFLKADRIVIGVADSRAETALRALYRPLTQRGVPLVVTGCENAELTKYAANGFLAMKVAFINEIADLCERFGGDVAEIARAVGMDSRIGAAFLQAGPGYGGSCFPKDTRALAATARDHGSPLELVETAVRSNDRRIATLADRIMAAWGSDIRERVIALLGLAFKDGTDDIRQSPAVGLLRDLQARGAVLRAYDPRAMANAREGIRNVVWCDDPYDACTGADIAVIATDWTAFRKIDRRRLGEVMAGRLLVDFRNLFRPEDIKDSGLRYVSVGRPVVDDAAEAPLGLVQARAETVGKQGSRGELAQARRTARAT